MAITVNNVLELPSLKEFRLVAGETGLDRIMEKTGIVDYEFADGAVPSSEDAFEKNSFVISTLLFAKDRPDWILKALGTLHAYGVSALAVKTIFFKELPPEVIRYANEADMPVFLFDHSHFEDVIAELREVLKEEQILQRECKLLGELAEGGRSREEVERLALELHPLLKQWNQAYYCVSRHRYSDWEAHRILNLFACNAERRQENAAFLYRNGFLFLVSDSRQDEQRFAKGFENGLRMAGLSREREALSVGRSKLLPREELDQGIRQAVCACTGAQLLGKHELGYAGMGFMRLLLEAEPAILKSCVEDFLDPLYREGDSGAELWKTAEAYVKTKGDIAMTSELLFLHPNTVRYRLGKLREKLDLEEGEHVFYQNISMAVWGGRVYGQNKE